MVAMQQQSPEESDCESVQVKPMLTTANKNFKQGRLCTPPDRGVASISLAPSEAEKGGKLAYPLCLLKSGRGWAHCHHFA